LSVGILNAIAAMAPVERSVGNAYGPGARHRLDVYLPAKRPDTALPVAFFLYGGGWDSGERSMYRFVGSALASHGFVTVIPDYRVYPETLFPGFIQDAALALRWTANTIAGLGGDATRLALVGHSAGAHIAAMLAFDRRWLGHVGLSSASFVRAWVGLAGPYDFLPLHSPVLQTIFGPEAGLAATQPINFVGPVSPPTLLLTGGNDTVVDPQNSARLFRRIRQEGGDAVHKLYPRLGHAPLIGTFSPVLRALAPALRDTVAFLRQHTGPQLPADPSTEVSASC
jgi:acetyl esterase/lipase